MIDLISAVSELITSWRFHLCVMPTAALAVGVGTSLDNEALAWVIAISSALIGVMGGFYWEWKAR